VYKIRCTSPGGYNTTFQGVKVLDIVNAAVEQNPDLSIGIVGNAAVGTSGTDNQGRTIYNINWSGDKTDFQGFTKSRADGIKVKYFKNNPQVKTFSIMDKGVYDIRGLKLSDANKDFTGITIFFRVNDAPAGNTRDPNAK
jgi:hypothetical protein